MSFKIINSLPSVNDVISAVPAEDGALRWKTAADVGIKSIVEGSSDKFLVIIGPCSADDEDAMLDYAHRLSGLADKLRDKLVIVPRAFTAKPRTAGTGYMGMLHGHGKNGEGTIPDAIYRIRKMYSRILSETGMGIAYELLYPELFPYFEDFVSYVTIGARSVENQQHRLVSSGLPVPVGMKNPTGGNISVMLNAVYAAQTPQRFAYCGTEVETTGNTFAHAILRGYVGIDGKNVPNYLYDELVKILREYLSRGLINPMITIDTNHSNSDKKYYEQTEIAKDVLQSRKKNDTLRKIVRGLIIESYIAEGSQGVGGGEYGKSVTDGCMSWEETEKLLYYIAENI